jgi:hypothetical protein
MSMLKRVLALCALMSLGGCASGAAERRAAPPDVAWEKVPEAVDRFCTQQCAEADDDGVVMVSRACYQECVGDILRKQGALMRRQGGRG